MYTANAIRYIIRQTALLGCMICCLFVLPSDSDAAKWESIPQELLTLQSNPYEPGAGALIVFNDAELRLFFKDKVWLEIETYRRIKVFNEEGKRYATVTIPHFSDDKISNIKARVILPNGDKIDMRAEAVVNVDRVSGVGRYSVAYSKIKKFTIPGVEDGAIIEYQFTRTSENIYFLSAWTFQGEDYTLSSTFTATVPKEVQYTGAFSNLTQQPESTVEKWVDGRGTTYSWKVENLPGIKEEPYGPPDYAMLASMNFVMTQIYDTWMRVPYRILDDWDRVTHYFRDAYRDPMGSRGRIPEVVQQITDGITDPAEKAAVIFDYVQRNIEYVNYWGIGPRGSKAGSILAYKQAENVDMNVLLCAMLDEAGINTSFAMLAPNDGLSFNSSLPTPVQFKRMITKVTMKNGQEMWLDPTIKGT